MPPMATPPRRFLGSHELAERWGVSRQRVFQILTKDHRMPRGEKLHGGQVWTVEEVEEYERLSGRAAVAPGPLVRRSPGHQQVLRGRLRGFHIAAAESGYTAWTDVIAIRDVPAPADAASYLRVPAGTPVVERSRIHGVVEGGRPPVMLSWTWVAPDVAEALPVLREEDTGEGGTTSRLIDAGWDPTWEEILLARNADEAQAVALGVAPGAALIEVWRPCTDAATAKVLEVTLRLINPAVHELVYP